MWNVESGTWDVECGMWNVECVMRDVERGTWNVECINVGTTRALSENGETADYQTPASSGQGTPCPYNNKEPQIKQINRILLSPEKHDNKNADNLFDSSL